MALALAERALGEKDIKDKHVLVIGAGRVGLQTLETLTRRGLRKVAVASRTRARASEVAARFGATAHDLDSLETAVAAADIVIAATHSAVPIVTEDAVRVAMATRDTPLVIVDLAVPADVERTVRDVAGVQFFDVDDLRAGLDQARAARLQEVPRVEAIVEDEVASFCRRYREMQVAPVLSALRRQAESLRQRELDRALSDLGELDPKVAERIEHLTRSLVTKLLHDPTIRLRDRVGAGDGVEVIALVEELFGITTASDQSVR
jgi:glutamyl-tRNA reductase